jgi:queuine tRNA-ribosyltransferase
MFGFRIIATDKNSDARLGILRTPHGEVNTPAFVFCATKANVKSVPITQVADLNTQMLLSNTYHLMLQPGADVVEKVGGLHRFIGWNGPMITDSGGFQIFSLGHSRETSEIKGGVPRFFKKNESIISSITREGCVFRSMLNGDKVHLTPESVIKAQHSLGADIIVHLDECTPHNVGKMYTAAATERSKDWASDSLIALRTMGIENQRLLAVIHGGVYQDLRRYSADFANENDFFGFAIGGSLGVSVEQMYDVISMTCEMLNRKRYVHLLGVGGIRDIFHGVKSGVDTFDCVSPTRIGRHGAAIIKLNELPDWRRSDRLSQTINLKSGRFKEDLDPISKQCGCPVCSMFSRAYLHHLFKAEESLAGTYISIHNIFTMNKLMEDIRASIENGTLGPTYNDWCEF